MAKLRKIFALISSIACLSIILLVYQSSKSPLPQNAEASRSGVRRLPTTLAPGSAKKGYCNHPNDIAIGAEGLPPNGYKLISATAVIRHGHRLPMLTTPPMGPFRISRTSCELNVSQSSMPHLLQKFIEKTKIHPQTETDWLFPLTPRGRCKPEDLTPLGVEQHIRSGLLLKEAYAEQLPLEQNNIQVVSTTFRRTYQSVVALLFGLFGDNIDFSSLRINSTNSTQLCRASKEEQCHCKRAEVLYQEAKRTLAGLRKYDTIFRKFNESIHKTFQKAEGGPYSLVAEYPWSAAHDLLSIWFCSGSGPYCKDDTCITESQINLNWRSLNSYYQEFSRNSDARDWAKLSMYHFLGELVQKFIRHSTHSYSIKDTISVYAGHDVTIQPLLLALELPLSQWPPYASRIIFELYKPTVEADTEEYLLKVIYNGKDLTRFLKFCTTRVSWSDSGCALRDFVNYFRNLLSGVGGDNFERACKL